MKCSMMKAIAICGALAFAVAGCKYDDEAAAGTGDEAVATDVGTDDGGTSLGTDVATDPGATTERRFKFARRGRWQHAV